MDQLCSLVFELEVVFAISYLSVPRARGKHEGGARHMQDEPNDIVMEIDKKDKPNLYAACTSVTCPQANTCLRSWAWHHTDDEPWCVEVVNPRFTSEDGHYPYYCSNEPQRYARGFAHFQKRMYPDQYREFMSACIARFGRNPYFMRRRGDTPLPPSEQAFIRSVLKQVGAPSDLDFDAYEDRLNWNCD